MDADVIIIGGGMVGAALALALAERELSGIVVDAQDLAATTLPAFDGRASAVAAASARLLRRLGLADTLDRHGCAIAAIRITEGTRPQVLDFDGDGEPLGLMIENRHLRAGLLARLAETPAVTVLAPAPGAVLARDAHAATLTLPDGRVFRAPVAVAADGRASPTREAAGIPVTRWSYPQSAVVTMLAHDVRHANIACQLFFRDGPLALLPMTPGTDGRDRTAIVWTVAARDAAGYARLGPRALAAEIAARIDGTLGSIEVIAPQSVWPLTFHHAARYHADRLLLVGDAAHGIHPIAGQGLNLGLRDAATAAGLLGDAAGCGLDLGSPDVLKGQDRQRHFDNALNGAVTDGLNRLFGLPGRAPSAVRRLGLTAVQRLPLLKNRLVAEARGEAGAVPALMRGGLG